MTHTCTWREKCIMNHCRGTSSHIKPRWRHQMEPFSALLAICAGNSPVPGEFPAQRPVTRSFDFFYLICAWINDLVNNGEAGELRCHDAHYDVIVMPLQHKINNAGITYWKTWGHLDGSGHPSVQLSPRQVRRVKPHARDETTSASNGQKAKLLKR